MDGNELSPANSVDSNLQAFNFLPEIYDVLKRYFIVFFSIMTINTLSRSFENNPSKLVMKMNDLKNKIEKSRTILATLPGLDVSMNEQQAYYEQLVSQYKRETELIDSYKKMCQFDVVKLDRVPNTLDEVASTLKEAAAELAAHDEANDQIKSEKNDMDESVKESMDT